MLVLRDPYSNSLTLSAPVLTHFGIEADTLVEIWDKARLSWVTTKAGTPFFVDMSQRSAFGRVKGTWGPVGFHLECRLTTRVNQAVFDDPWCTDLTRLPALVSSEPVSFGLVH